MLHFVAICKGIIVALCNGIKKSIPVLPSSRSDISWGLPGLKGYKLFLSQQFSRTVGKPSSNFRLFAMSHYPLLEYVNCKCFSFNTLTTNFYEPHPVGNFSSNDILSCIMHCTVWLRTESCIDEENSYNILYTQFPLIRNVAKIQLVAFLNFCPFLYQFCFLFFPLYTVSVS